MCGQQGITRHVRSHVTIAQDKMGQDCEHRLARGALEPPDHDSAQTDAYVMRMACEAAATTTGSFVFELKAKGQHEGEDTFEERLPIAQQLEIGRFALEIDGDGAIFAGLASSVAHGHPSGIRSRKLTRHHGGNAWQSQDQCAGLRGLPLKTMECGRNGSPSCTPALALRGAAADCRPRTLRRWPPCARRYPRRQSWAVAGLAPA